MGTVIIKAKCGEIFLGDKKFPKVHLNNLDGIDCQDEFVEYFDSGELKNKLVFGYMNFKFEKGILYTVTTYTTKEVLTDDELDELGSYTQGQWSDGIGEGFEQYPCDNLNGKEVYISPWYSGQQIDIIQK